MYFEPEQIYHIYNRGNRSQKIFETRDNYLYFLGKARKQLSPFCDFLSYCLMPNHFHFLVYTKNIQDNIISQNELSIHPFSRKIGTLLSSYSQAFNNSRDLTGSLFQQKTKSKLLNNKDGDYPFICFNYIHQNPLKAGMVDRMEDWEFSSFRDYIGLRNGTLCNRILARNLFDLPENEREFYEMSYKIIHEDLIHKVL